MRYFPFYGLAPKGEITPFGDGESAPATRRAGEARSILQFHALRYRDPVVRWWVLPEHLAPPPPARPQGVLFGDRRDRGALAIIENEPTAETKPDKAGVHRFTLDPTSLRAGRWRVVCRARDTTILPGEKWPWVLKDSRGLLESERAWWVEK